MLGGVLCNRFSCSPWFGLAENEILQSLSPKDREREFHPCVNLRQWKRISASVELCETEVCFLHIPTCWHDMFDFPKCIRVHLMFTLNLQGLLQNHNLETILICIVVLCFPHNNIVRIHTCDECKRSNALNVCSQSIKYQVYQYEPRKDICEPFVNIRLTSSPTDFYSDFFEFDGHQCMVVTTLYSC